jgi:transcriptional regulator with XRE-family HTH domain
MDYDQIAAEFLRALRGKRSQPAFCRRLGYKSNVVYTWESKRGFPTAVKALQAARRVGVDLDAALNSFYRRPPSWVGTNDFASREGVAQFLTDLKGHTSIVDLARYSGKSRFAIARWLKGETEPKLPEFFHMVESSSLRLIDLLETLVDPRALPSVRERWELMDVVRRLAYDAPWTQGVLRALELDAYRRLPAHRPGWIAERIGIDLDEEQRCLSLLEQTGQIRREGEHWSIADVMALDTRKDPEAALRLRTWWGDVALKRFAEGKRGMMYNLCSVSEKDVGRLRELQKAYFNEVRTIVAQSEPIERVVLATVQLLDLGEHE